MVLSDSAASIIFATAAYKELLSKRLDQEQAFDCVDDLGLLACYAEYYKLALHVAQQRGATEETQEIVSNNCVGLVGWLRKKVMARLTFKSSIEDFAAANSSTNDESIELSDPIVYATMQISLRLLTDSVCTGLARLKAGEAIIALLEELLTCVGRTCLRHL